MSSAYSRGLQQLTKCVLAFNLFRLSKRFSSSLKTAQTMLSGSPGPGLFFLLDSRTDVGRCAPHQSRDKPLCYVPGGLKYMVCSVCNLLVPEWWQMLLLIYLPGSLNPYMKHKLLTWLFCYMNPVKTALNTRAAIVS